MSFLLTLVGGGLLLKSMELFLQTPLPAPQSWCWYYAGLLLSLAGLALWGWQGQWPGLPAIRLKRTHLILALILLGAVGLRLVRLHYSEGVWGDEAEAGLTARQALQDSSYRPIYIPSIHITWVQVWLYSAALAVGGDGVVWPLRLVSVAFGVGSVYLGYWVGRQWRGETFGLGMAFFLAIMRWSLTFSQLAITGIEVAFFTLLLLHSLKRLAGRLSFYNAVYVGLVLGFGLLFYMAFRVVAVGLLLIFLAHVSARRAALGRLVISAWVALLILWPLLAYAWRFPDEFWRRNRDLIITQDVPLQWESLPQALAVSLSRYAGMFHLRGDGWELYNARAMPMLDPIMGALLLVGLGAALYRWRSAEAQTFLLLLGLGLLPAILTVSRDAPHAGRSIAVLPAVAYCCTLALEWGRDKLTLSHWRLGVGAILLASLAWNSWAYYDQQLRSFETWYRTARARLVLQSIHESGYPQAEWQISNRFYPVRPLQFLAPHLRLQGRENVDFIPTGPLPLTPQYLLLDGRDTWAVDYLRFLFPQAQFTPLDLSPYGLHDLRPHFTPFYRVILDEASLAAFNQRLAADPALLTRYGWQGYYYPNVTLTGQPAFSRLTPSLFQYFHLVPFEGQPYSARWLGCLSIPEARDYRLALATVGEAALYLDGELLLQLQATELENWLRGENAQVDITLPLEAGRYPIEARYWNTGQGHSNLYLTWDGEQAGVLLPFSPLSLSPRRLGSEC